MADIIASSAYWAVAISLVSYALGDFLKRKFRNALLNPILISVVITIFFLLATGTEYESYHASSKLIGWFLTPATVCLAIPLYEKLAVLRENALAIAVGISVGVISSFACILGLGIAFGIDHATYVTLLPKSVTTAIGLGLSESSGGYVPITALVIILTGITGNIAGPYVMKTLHVTDPVARGLAFGTSSHAIGTSKAFEFGDVEGAVSSLSIVVAGILTVLEFILVRNII